MVDVTIYVRNMNKEQWQKKLGWLTFNDEPADMGVADKLEETIHIPGSIEEGNKFCREWRYLYDRKEVSDALEHLEKIANGFEDEQGALLYVNNEDTNVHMIALNIVKYGRESVWWKYDPVHNFGDAA